jgi:hypothetical protein
MMYPYGEFLLDFHKKHGGLTHRNSAANTRAAIMIESRPNYFLPMVLRNTMFFLGPSWNLHIVCGDFSEPFIRRTTEAWSVSIIKMNNVYRFARSQYNALLTARQFWERFTEEKLLIFQSDCILAGSNIDEFIQYDFIGAPSGPFDGEFIINGGLSLRTRSKMIECATRAVSRGEPEDVFFSQALRQNGGALPDFDTACRFSVESIYKGHPVGVHGTDKYYHLTEVAEKIVRAIRY